MTNCKDCPLGAPDYERRILFHGDEDNAETFMWCDKVGGEVYFFGRCEDAYSEEPTPEHHSKKKRRNKRERDLAYKNHLKTLHQNCTGYPSPVWYKDEIYIRGYGYIENPKPYYKRLSRDNHKGGRFSYFKNYSNRQVRRYNGELQNGGAYKKVFDYWYTVI